MISLTAFPRVHALGQGAGSQRGITMIGLMAWAFVICVLALLGMKVTPALLEYQTISRMVNKAAQEGGSTVAEIRAAYDRSAQIEYGVEAIKSGRDLDITKENEQVVIRFAYDKEIELIDPVYLLIKFEGQSK